MVRGFAQLPDQVRRRPSRAGVDAHRPGAAAHIEAVQHRSTRLTLATREFETERPRRPARTSSPTGVVGADPAGRVDGQPLPPWEPGAHVDLDPRRGRHPAVLAVRRPGRPHTWRLGILRDPNGSGGSLHVHDRLQAGDTVRVRGPRNNFPLVAVPPLPVHRRRHRHHPDPADDPIRGGGRRRVASWSTAAASAPRWRSSTSSPPTATGSPSGRRTRRASSTSTALLGEPHGRTPWSTAAAPSRCWPPSSSAAPPGPKGALHVERFVAKPLTEPVLHRGVRGRSSPQSGLTLTVPPDSSILAVVEEAGVGVLSSCREGTCGTCETRGARRRCPTTATPCSTRTQREAGDCMMICVSRACTSRLVLDL